MRAKLFKSGRSQVLRLPACLHLKAQEVRIEKIGGDLWVHPERSRDADLGQWLQHFFATTEPLPESFLANRDGGAPSRA
jgi:antitoxin VapB